MTVACRWPGTDECLQREWFGRLIVGVLRHFDHVDSGCVVAEVVPFDAQWCHMGTAIKHPMPGRVKPSFVIFDIRAL